MMDRRDTPGRVGQRNPRPLSAADRQRLWRERQRLGLKRQAIDIPEEWADELSAQKLIELGFCDWDDIERYGLPRILGEFLGEKLDGY